MYAFTGVKNSEWRLALSGLGVNPNTMSLNQAAGLLRCKGMLKAAEAAYRELLTHDPDHLESLHGLVALLAVKGGSDELVDIHTRIAAIEVKRIGIVQECLDEAIKFKLAALRLAPTPQQMPSAYTASLFNRYAEGFDEHLLVKLQYRCPEVLFNAVLPCIDKLGKAFNILDLGCGTGLLGQLFHPFSRRLDGIDLSDKMLEKARERGIYNDLEVGDLTDFMLRRRAAFDLVLAADVFVYIGDLQPAFAAAKMALRPGGLFAFSVEETVGNGYRLSPAGRYAHPLNYLRDLAQSLRLSEISAQQAILRYENRQPVVGTIMVLRAPENGIA